MEITGSSSVGQSRGGSKGGTDGSVSAGGAVTEVSEGGSAEVLAGGTAVPLWGADGRDSPSGGVWLTHPAAVGSMPASREARRRREINRFINISSRCGVMV
jgi:hypothetical protein